MNDGQTVLATSMLWRSPAEAWDQVYTWRQEEILGATAQCHACICTWLCVHSYALTRPCWRPTAKWRLPEKSTAVATCNCTSASVSSCMTCEAHLCICCAVPMLYGIHHLEGCQPLDGFRGHTPPAILQQAAEPVDGPDIMLQCAEHCWLCVSRFAALRRVLH